MNGIHTLDSRGAANCFGNVSGLYPNTLQRTPTHRKTKNASHTLYCPDSKPYYLSMVIQVKVNGKVELWYLPSKPNATGRDAILAAMIARVDPFQVTR